MTKKDITNILGVFIIITPMTTISSASTRINIVAFVIVMVITAGCTSNSTITTVTTTITTS